MHNLNEIPIVICYQILYLNTFAPPPLEANEHQEDETHQIPVVV